MARVVELKTASTKEIFFRSNKKIIDRIVGNDIVKINFHLDLSDAYESPINLPSLKIDNAFNN